MQSLGNIERNNTFIKLFLVTEEELISLKRKPYELAFNYKDSIFITENFMKLTKNTRSVIMEHEVAHALGIDDEVGADRRAVLCYSIETFKEAVRESYHFMNQFIKKNISEIDSLIEKRISLVSN